jgi:hypothetical protein
MRTAASEASGAVLSVSNACRKVLLKEFMPTYEIYVHCVFCAGERPLLMKVHVTMAQRTTKRLPSFFLKVPGHRRF